MLLLMRDYQNTKSLGADMLVRSSYGGLRQSSGPRFESSYSKNSNVLALTWAKINRSGGNFLKSNWATVCSHCGSLPCCESLLYCVFVDIHSIGVCVSQNLLFPASSPGCRCPSSAPLHVWQVSICVLLLNSCCLVLP